MTQAVRRKASRSNTVLVKRDHNVTISNPPKRPRRSKQLYTNCANVPPVARCSIQRLRRSKQLHTNCANILPVATFPIHEKRVSLCVWMDIKMPKPIIKVRMEVPPRLTSGKGTPTTGNKPETIPMLTNT